MSKDIRSFFQVLSKKTGDNPKPIQKPKKVSAIIDSDDDDFVKKPSPKKTLTSKRRAQILSSDSEDDSKSKKDKSPPKKKKVVEENLKLVNLDVLNKPIKQSKVEYIPKAETSKSDDKSSHKGKERKKKDHKKKNKKNTELGIHGDKDFEKTLEDLDQDSDDTILLDNLDIFDRTIEEENSKSNKVVEKKENSHNIEEKSHHETKVSKEKTSGENSKYREHPEAIDNSKLNKNKRKNENGHDKDKEHKIERKQEKIKDVKETGAAKDRKQEKERHQKLKMEGQDKDELKEKTHEEKGTPKKAEKRQRKNSESTPTSTKKPKLEHTDSGLDPDEEKWQRKMNSSVLYQAYLHRQPPKNQGQKVYPKGKSDCLRGITFLKTGVLDSLEGDDFRSLVSDHGGKSVHSISKKVNYVVVGDEPGPAKLEKARNYKIPEINEDQFLDMILVKSGMNPRYAVKNVSEDFGLGDSEFGSEEFMQEDLVLEDSHSNEYVKKNTSHTKVKEELDSKDKFKEPSGKAEFKQEINKNKISDELDDKGFKEIKTEPSVSIKGLNEIKPVENVKMESNVRNKLEIGSSENLCWTEKYKPSSIKEIIGQQDPNSNMNKLKKWLENWFKNQDPVRRAKMAKPNPFKPCGSGEYYKAALLSGPPGVGKTTTATLVTKELGYDIVEFNASDTRNKKLLHEEISQMMNSKTVAGFVSGENNVNKKRVLLMDEVDGMAGNEDRGGIAELINFIKKANFPIICMCNNREHQKMRTLVTHCFELRFGKPNITQVRGAMLSICFKEGLKIKPDALARLIIGTGCDIRQTLNHLTMWSAAEKNISSEVIQKESKNSQKDVVLGPWDVIRTVFTTDMNKDMTLSDKSRLFFYDYSLGPLFVQENYIHVLPDCVSKSEEEKLLRFSLTADSLSKSDLIESKIRSTNNWSLLESQAFYSTVLPSHYISGKLLKCNFPLWFGQNSKRNKRLRIINELYSHARARISGDKNAMLLEYAEALRDLILRPLKEKGTAGVIDTLDVMKNYSILREDMMNLFELLTRFGQPNFYEKDISVSVKAALTRSYNKNMVLSFAPPVASKKAKSEKDEQLPDEEEEELSDEEVKDDNVDDDTLIKVKTKAKASSSKASTSKRETKGKEKASKTDSKGRKTTKGKK